MRKTDRGAVASDASPAPASSYLLGAVWAGVNAASSVLLPFALFVFFAREISPPVLGLIALATACTELFKAVGLPGVYEALLQQKTDLQRCHETALALLLCASAVLVPLCVGTLYGLGFLVPGLHAHFIILALLTLRIPLDLATVQPQAILVARLAYRRLAVRTVVANLVAGGFGVLVALVVAPIYGLVTYQLVQSGLTFGSTAIGRGLLVRPRLHGDCVRRLRSETLLSTGNRVLAASINYLDQMAIAPLAGKLGLAYYNLGKRLETTFVTVANSFSSILFQPLFAADGALSRQKATWRALFVLSVVCGIPAAVVFSNSHAVVALVFGRRWLAAAPLVGWLSLNGFVRAVGMVPGSFLSVSGRNRELLMTSIASAIGSMALVFAFAGSSILLCAMGMVVKNAVIVGWMAWLSRGEVRQPALTYALTALVPVLLMISASGMVAMMMPIGAGATPSRSCTLLCLSGLAALLVGGAWIGLAHLWSLRLPEPAPALNALP
ncbi:oligosaccharide flippase family protein [Lichenicola sp.]|uniref:oligosaccharide flippase family protein n=1 Tax=Lichenicola sp. TaxID=2804529 RepID=UPI003B00E5C2